MKHDKYSELRVELRNSHFYAEYLIEMKHGKEVCTGLVLQCPPIIAATKLIRVMGCLPEGWSAQYVELLQEIHITKPKKHG